MISMKPSIILNEISGWLCSNVQAMKRLINYLVRRSPFDGVFSHSA